MVTLAQLQDEPWWGREVVTPELDWCAGELCRRTGRPRTAAGTKGNAAHLRGAHRSQEWILRSVWCTSRTYTVQSGLTADQARHVGGLDFVPGVWGTAANRALTAVQTRRLVDAAKAGRLAGVREIIGTLDGRTVYGYRVTTGERFSADDTHLDHWHLTVDRRRLTDRALMERILAVALGEDEDVSAAEVWAQPIVSPGAGINEPAGEWLKQARLAARAAEVGVLAARAELAALTAVVGQLAAALGAGGGSVDTAAILAGVDAALAPIRAAVEALPDTAEVREETEDAVREVLGSVDQ